MSFHRENVIWQSPEDKLWRRGFFTTHECWSGGDDEDFDPEWDVEYDFGSFEWTSPACSTKDEAYRSWKGSNPGTVDVCPAADEDAAKYDHMWKMHRDPEYAASWTKKNHDDFITREQKKIHDNVDLSRLRVGATVSIMLADKLNPGRSVLGATGKLVTDSSGWLCLDGSLNGKPVKVYNPETHTLYRHKWDAVVGLTIHDEWRRRGRGYGW